MANVCPDAYAAELHEPDGDGAVGGLRRLAVRPRGRPVPLGARHARVPGRDGRRADGRDRRSQTSGFNHQAFVMRFEHEGEDLYPRSTTSIDADPEGSVAGCGSRSTGAGVLPDRVQRALRRVRALVHAPRRADRAVPHPGRRLHRPHRGGLAEYERSCASSRRASPLPLEPGSELASDIIHAIETGTPRALYANVKQHGPDRRPARRLLRRGAVPRRPRPACSRRAVRRVPRASRRR